MKEKITLSFDLEQVCNDILAKCNLISISIRDAALEDIKANVQEPDSPETRSIICRAVTEAFGKVKVACQRYLTRGRTSDNNDLERLVANSSHAIEEVEVQDEDSQGRSLWYAVDGSGHQLYLYEHEVSNEVRTDLVYQSGDNWYIVGENSPLSNVTSSDFTKIEVYKSENNYYLVGSGTEVSGFSGISYRAKTHTEERTSDEIDSYTFEEVVLVLEIPNFNTAVTDHLKSMIHKYVVDWTMGRFLQDQLADKAAEYKELADVEDYDNIVKDLNARERYTMRKAAWA